MEALVFAPTPDFRYVSLVPRLPSRPGAAALAFGLATGSALTLATGAKLEHALLAGASSSAAVLLGARSRNAPAGGTRMAIVPWGVLIGGEEAPRVLRWAAVERVELESRMPLAAVLGHGARILSSLASTSRALCRVVIETRRERYVGEAPEHAPLERLVAHLGAYTREQAAPIALGLDEGSDVLPPGEPFAESLLASARGYLASAKAMAELDLPSSGYRRGGARAATHGAERALRRVLSDRRGHSSDRRAFAAVVAAEIGAVDVVPELVRLTQSPHPCVASVARQAARALGVSRARAGALDEVSPFLWDVDRTRLDAWSPERMRVSAAG